MVKKQLAKNVKACIKMAAILCTVSVGLNGCGTEVGADESSNTVIVDRTEYSSNYTLTTVKRADVVSTKTIRARYKELTEESIFFADEGRRVTALHVEKGDIVKKGDLLAELEGADQAETIETLEYQIARNQKLLSYTDTDEAYEKSKRWWDYVYQSNGSDAAESQLKEDLKEIEQKYRYLREDYQDAIDLANMKLDGLKEVVETGLVYASMDGRITYVVTDLLGTISQTQNAVIKIADNSACLFEVTDSTYAEYFEEGEVITMQLGGGKNAEDVEVIPYNIDSWEKSMYFEMIQTDTSPTVEVNDSGVITLELDRKEQVLSLPKSAVHTADGKTYVYVLGENDIREVRWVEIGLKGDSLIEIISGLTEGESVVLK